MSFASNVKAEMCRPAIGKKCCAVAECFGVLLFGNTFSGSMIKVVTENPDFAERLPKLFKRAFHMNFDVLPEELGGGKFVFQITDPAKIAEVFDTFGFSARQSVSLHVNYGILEDDCCRASFVRGAFLAGGSVTDPEKRYHLELTTSHQKVARETDALLLDMGYEAKLTGRNGSTVLYFKQSEIIEDFLTLLGAPVCAMDVMQAKMEKDLRNGVNRRVNCETANLTKVVDAAQEQIAAIRHLQELELLDNLPEKLKQSAQLRLDNPEATLQELADMMDPPVSKSAMNHRMRKLLQLSKES